MLKIGSAANGGVLMTDQVYVTPLVAPFSTERVVLEPETMLGDAMAVPLPTTVTEVDPVTPPLEANTVALAADPGAVYCPPALIDPAEADQLKVGCVCMAFPN